ncbi:nucleotidyltransferase domain-containing protein [soil metagenome]
MQFGLKDETIQKMNSIFKEFNSVDKVIIYGSRAKGNFRPGSDIDLTIEGKDLNLRSLSQISIKLDDLSLPYLLDLSIKNKITKQELLDHIERVGKVFYVSNPSSAEV